MITYTLTDAPARDRDEIAEYVESDGGAMVLRVNGLLGSEGGDAAPPEGNRRTSALRLRLDRLVTRLRALREWLAYKIAPWTYVPHREEREDAFRELALIAYGSRDAVWTSPRVLVESALREAARRARR